MTDFLLQVKSSLDKAVSDLAAAQSLQFTDLDDQLNSADLLTGESNCLVWRFMNMDEDPQDPLYSIMFMVGVKTTHDPSRYNLAAIMSDIQAVFRKGDTMPVRDYSTATPPTVTTGEIIFSDSGVDPQAMDRSSGVRLLTVNARALRYP